MPRMPIKPGSKPDLGGRNGLADLLSQAMTLHNRGHPEQAASVYHQILRLSPKHFDATHLLAVASAQLGQADRSRELFARALALRPHHAETHFNKGTMERAAGNLAVAAADFGRVLELAPDHLGALNNRSLTLQQLQRFEEALSDSDRLAVLAPADAAVHNNRGALLHGMMRLDEALVCLNRAIEIKPDYVEALNNRGNLLKDLHRFDDAIVDYDGAIAIDADFAEAPFNKSIALLLQGEFEAGWKLWEWRWQQTRLTSPKRHFEAPLWRGDGDISGKTILLHSEQGLGDTIQFIRYARMVADLGARVVVEAPASLHPLLTATGGIDRLVGKEDRLPSFDFHCPLMSLPLAFGTTLETVPVPAPYLAVSPDRVAFWSARLGRSSRPRVAVAWRGNPKNSNDRNRSADLVDIERHLSPDMDWLCLHHDLDGPERRRAESIGHLSIPLDGDTDLEDAAAICAIADAVVTVDTSFAHIAGALGKTSFVMLPFTPDWRWMMRRHDSPWYPQMTLCRQDEGRDWGPVMRDVGVALRARLAD